MKNWYDIWNEWVVGLKNSCNFGNNTNNRTENANRLLKQVTDKFSNLKRFFVDLEVAVDSMRLERDRRHADAIMKRPCLGDKDNVPDMKYASLLTPYAYKIVVKQMQLSEKVNIDSSEDKVTLIISSGETTVTATSCSCGFVLLYLLPCRHVLAMRKKLGLDVYFTDLVHETWCLAKYNDNSKISLVTPTRVSDDKSSSAPVSIPVSVMQRREVLTQSQKYKTAFVKAQKLAELASEFSMLEYNKRLAILAKLVSCWEQDQDVEVVNFSEEVFSNSNTFWCILFLNCLGARRQ